MLPKKFRLSLKKKISPEKTYFSQLFIVKFQRNTLSYNRYGFIISKKVDLRASVRNKVKRLFHDSVVVSNISQTGYDILFIVKKKAAHVAKEEIAESIQKTLC